MSSWRSSNVDEMVRAALAEEESLLPKEKERWRVPHVVDFAIVCCVLPSAGGVSYPDAVVKVAANDDGVVPGCPGGGTAVWVAADDDGIVPGRPGGGTPQSPAWCSTLQMMAPSRIRRSSRTSPMESVLRWPQ